MTVKLAELQPVPVPVVTQIEPLIALLGMVTERDEDETVVNTDAEIPPTVTPFTRTNPEPVTVTTVPTGPLVGENELTPTAVGVACETWVTRVWPVSAWAECCGCAVNDATRLRPAITLLNS